MPNYIIGQLAAIRMDHRDLMEFMYFLLHEKYKEAEVVYNRYQFRVKAAEYQKQYKRKQRKALVP